MNEQIMKILPAKKEVKGISVGGKGLCVGYWNDDRVSGYNIGRDDCAAAIEKANLVRCPTEEEIEIVMHNAYFKHKELIKSTDAGMLKEYAKAIFALLRGEK